MDLASLEDLLTPQGQAALAAAAELQPREKDFLRCHTKLSKRFSSDLARSALQQTLWRHRAASKFCLAERMYFEREALEQASGEQVAQYRARRFSGFSCVADLCCGLGGDAIALAGCTQVLAVDRDALRLRLAELNLLAHGLADRVQLLHGDALQVALPQVQAVFADPDRRVEGRRTLSVEQGEPSLSALRSRFSSDLALAVKLSPALPTSELNRLEGEVEFLSLDGELKECVQWIGPLAGPRRRATLLPGGGTLAAEASAPPAEVGPPADWLYDPDPAVVRAGLVGDLARLLGARQIDRRIAYLTSAQPLQSPFVRRLAIEASLPFHLPRLRDYLRQHQVGSVQITRRGSAVEPDQLQRQLKLTGSEQRILVLTQFEARPWVLVCQLPSS